MNKVVADQMENCDQEIANVKKQTFNYVLKKATDHLLLKQYQKSRLFFEKTKKMYYNDANIDEYGIKDVDLCVIDYALIKCYSTNKKHFQKRSELLTTLGERGRIFPPLSYEQALLVFQQQKFNEAKDLINTTLHLISKVDQNMFKAYWPASNHEIPESNLTVLRNMLQSLKQQCQIELDKQLKDENFSDDASYHSDSSLDNDQLPTNILVSESVNKALNVLSSFPVKPELLSKQENSPHCFLVDTDDNNESILTDKSTLESKPIESSSCQNRNLQKLEWTPVLHTDFSNDYDYIDYIKESQLSNANMNISLNNLDDSIKVLTSKLVDSMALQEQFQKHSSDNEETINKNIDLILSQLIENRDLRMKVKTLETEVDNQKEYSLELERYYAEEDKLKSIKRVKLEVQIEELQKAMTKQEDVIKKQEQKIKLLETCFTEQFSRFCSLQKQEVVRQVNRCVNMMNDLNAAAPYLTSTSAPSIDECRLSISRWEKQLHNVKEYSTALDVYFQSLFNQICNNESILQLNQPELYTDFSELRDILHDNYIPTVVYFIKSRTKNSHNLPPAIPQHVSWYGRFSPQPVQMAPVPYYQNHPESHQLYKHENIQNLTNTPTSVMFGPPNLCAAKVSEGTSHNKTLEAVKLETDEMVDILPEHKTNSFIEDEIKEEDVFEKIKLEDSECASSAQDCEIECKDANLQVVETNPQNLECQNGLKITGSAVTSSCSHSDQESDLLNLNDPGINKITEQVSDAAKAIGGPKFYNLFLYVKKKIENTDEEVLLTALKNVRQKKVKLSGMTREDILRAVHAELNSISKKVENNFVQLQKDVSDNICVICYDQYDDVSKTVLKCSHSFHFNCIRKWFVTNSICPICRLHTAADEDFQTLT